MAQITGTTHRALEPTQELIDLSTVKGQQSGLRFDFVVNCVNLATLDLKRVLRKLGSLPDVLMQELNEALKAAL